MKKLAALLMVLANLTLLAAGQTVTNSLVKGPACPTVTWEPSLDSAVTGYYVTYGDLAQGTMQVVEVGNVHSLTLTNLAANATNFIYVTSHDAAGAQSDPSEVLLYCPTPDAAAAPTISPNGGAITTASAITLTSATPGGVIYYSCDGGVAKTYAAPFTLAAGTRTVTAYTVAPGYAKSAVASAAYSVVRSRAAATPAPSVAVVARTTALTLSVREAVVVVQFPVAPGIRYSVQASSDLKAWATVGVAEPEVSGISEYVDANAAQAGQRFYRVVTEEPQALVLR